MTHTTQALPEIGTSRRKRVIGAAYEYIASQKLSREFKSALLGGHNSNGRISKRPAFLRLYFAMKAHNFPVSEASRQAADDQRQMRSLAQKQRLAARIARNAMPTELKMAGAENQRLSWISNRIQAAQARKANGRITRLAAE